MIFSLPGPRLSICIIQKRGEMIIILVVTIPPVSSVRLIKCEKSPEGFASLCVCVYVCRWANTIGKRMRANKTQPAISVNIKSEIFGTDRPQKYTGHARAREQRKSARHKNPFHSIAGPEWKINI